MNAATTGLVIVVAWASLMLALGLLADHLGRRRRRMEYEYRRLGRAEAQRWIHEARLGARR